MSGGLIQPLEPTGWEHFLRYFPSTAFYVVGGAFALGLIWYAKLSYWNLVWYVLCAALPSAVAFLVLSRGADYIHGPKVDWALVLEGGLFWGGIVAVLKWAAPAKLATIAWKAFGAKRAVR